MSQPTSTVVAHRPWLTAFLAGLASYLDSALLVSSGVGISVLYAPSMHLAPATIGLILGCEQLAFGIGAFLGGRLGDRFGRRRILTVALIGLAVGSLILALATGPAMLFPGVVLAGLGVGADLPVALAMANEVSAKGKKGRGVALSQLLWTLGIASVNLVVSFVGHRGVTGGRVLFGGLVGVAIIVLLLRLLMPESPEWTAAHERTSGSSEITSTVRYKNLGQVFRRPVVWAVLALAIYYSAWNVGASINGKYAGYIWTKLANGGIETYSRFALLSLPITFVASILFMAVVDTRYRRIFTAIGTVLIILGWAPLAFFGASQLSLLAVVFLFNIGSSMAGEPLFKVWSQEMVPTLLRGTSQGVTIAVARIIAAVLAFIVPPLLAVAPTVVFVGIFGFSAVAGLVWLLWVPRLRKADEIEAPPLTVVDNRTAQSAAEN